MTIWQWSDHISAIAGALRVDELTLALTIVFVVAGTAAVILSWRAQAPRESGPRRVPRAAAGLDRGHGRCSSPRRTSITLFIGIELLSIPLYVLCATEMRRAVLAGVGPEVPVIGSVGSATLLYGLALLYGATGATDFSAIATLDRRRPRLRRAAADRHRARARRPLLQGLGGAVPPVDARRLRGRADADHGVHGGRDEGRRVRRPAARSSTSRCRRPARLGAGARDAGHDHDRRRQRRRARRSPRSSACSPTRRSRRPATCWAASSSRAALGVAATIFYLVVYLLMNLAAFAVIIARERETPLRRRHRRASPGSARRARSSPGR